MSQHELPPPEKLKAELVRAIRNINRNLYEWKDRKKNKTNFSISYTEVYSVVRTWIMRCMRTCTGIITIDQLFRQSHLYVSIDEANFCLAKLSLDHVEEYRSIHGAYKIVSQILEEINYKSLKYNPSDYEMDGLTIKTDAFNPTINSSFENLENFKF